MTSIDAVAVACVGHARRRLLAALVRTLLGRALPDIDILPPRAGDEPIIPWACRCAAVVAGASRLTASEVRRTAEAQLARATAAGLVAIPIGSPEYPAPLAEIPDPPPVLWLQGRHAALAGPAVAIVGSRAASPYGLEMARQLATDLASRGVTIVSGLARGIDSAAHRAAVGADGVTVGVLGSGVDRVYPAEHGELAAAMCQRGAVVAELPPGTPPLPHHFPLRNRLISGMSSAVVVVEASEKSGSLITAGCALEQGREVMAVPGPVRAGRYRGAHALLRDGAKLVETADDILQELCAISAPGAAPGVTLDDLGLAIGPEVVDFSLDDVSEWTGLPAAALLPRLLELELLGRIQRIGGGRFVRSLKPVLT
jgi:DNA processing protein